jgi:rRNA maturation endonuclease Nob1
MFAFVELDSVHWLLGLLVTCCVVTFVVVLVRRAGRSIEDPALRKMCPLCGQLIPKQAGKCEYCGGSIDKSRRGDK